MSKVSGIKATEQSSGSASAPAGRYGKAAWFVESGAVAKNTLINSKSDVDTLFAGDARLIKELKAYQLNALDKASIVVRSLPAGELTVANLGEMINAVKPNVPEGVEFLVFDIKADLTFVQGICDALTLLRANKERYKPLFRFRKALALDLEGVAAVDGTSGKTSIPATSHGLNPGDEIVIFGTVNYDGSYVLDAASDADNLVFTHVYTAETFPAGATLEETPASYQADATVEFQNFSDLKAGIVTPTDQDTHLGAVMGVISSAELSEEPGWVEKFALNGVEVNDTWINDHMAELEGLMSARFIVIKKHQEDLTNYFINRANTMSAPTDDYDSIPYARIADKLLYEVEYYGFPAVNSGLFPKDDAGANAVAKMASKGIPAMMEAGELNSAIVKGEWNTDGGIDLTVDGKGPNFITVVNETVTLSPQ